MLLMIITIMMIIITMMMMIMMTVLPCLVKVFLLDSQRSSSGQSSKVDHDDQKSFVFLVYPPDCASSDPTEATRSGWELDEVEVGMVDG